MKTILLAAALVLTTLAQPALSQGQAGQQPPAGQQGQAAQATPSPQAQDIIFSGKLYSPLKLSVQLPFTAQILNINAKVGQKVKKNETLLTYEIGTETRLGEKRSLNLAQVKDIEHQYALAVKDADKLRVKRKELEVMEKQNMATSQALVQNAQEIDVLEKQKAALQEKLALERDLAQLRLELARDRFGPKANFGSLPHEGVIKAPVEGYVLWINPELNKGVKLIKDAELFQVGLLDPMVIRAQVHEIEAMRLNLGDQAKVAFDSIPGKEFTATVSRIPWAPLPTLLQQPSYYEIELTLPNPDLSLKEGLKGQVTIIPKKQG